MTCLSFNPRTPAGCDCRPWQLGITGWCFNPRTPAGCDGLLANIISPHLRFNPRTPAGCDLGTTLRTGESKKFQSTHPCGVRRGLVGWYAYQAGFQSTHPCGVRLTRYHNGTVTTSVSIHAPLRGATSLPHWGCRGPRCFNPRTPAGCDGMTWKIPTTTTVSIHAPLRGATCCECGKELKDQFQSTHPCGVRPAPPQSHDPTYTSFNPRTPAGCDAEAGAKSPGYTVSIHAPLRGATRRQIQNLHGLSRFNPRTPAGCDCLVLVLDRIVLKVSIHAPLRGATPLLFDGGNWFAGFNPRTPAGCDACF